MNIRDTTLWKILRKIFGSIRSIQGFKKQKIYGITYFGKEDFKYQRKLRKERLTKKRIYALEDEMWSLPYKPKISVVMPVYNVEKQWLKEAIDSVIVQVYPNWELCIADDASPGAHIKEVLDYYSKKDERIKVVYLENNLGIAGASNAALSFATGKYIAFLDHDDCLSRDSFFEVVKLLNEKPQADLIYSNEDKLTMGGMRLRPVYKTSWDPELFLSYNYLCHLVVCRAELIERIGGFREGFDGSQDYDLLLRITELTPHIFHIPKVLYHWRMIPGSTAAIVDAKSKAFGSARRALEDALKRRQIDGVIEDAERPGTFKVRKITKEE